MEETIELENFADRQTGFTHKIARRLTHKRRVENVFVTSMDRLADDVFLCGAFVPQANAYLNGMRTSPNDVALTITEIGRQMGIALCHTYMNVAEATVFVLNTVQYEILPHYHGIDWDTEDTVSGKITFSRHAYRADGSLGSVRAAGEFSVDGKMIFLLCCDWSIQPAQSGKRLREISRLKSMRNAHTKGNARPLEGLTVQRVLQLRQPAMDDRLWVGGRNRFSFAATLQVDLANQFFFDHESDHVPGMLIIEGMRELALDAAMRFPMWSAKLPCITHAELAYKNYGELNAPVFLTADIENRDGEVGSKELTIHVAAVQFGTVISEGTVIVR